MTAENNQLANTESAETFVRASTALSQQLGLEPRAMIDAIKTQFFKGKDATDAQLAVLVSTARALGLNPLIPGQLYPYPDRSGAVTIMLGPDGIFTLLANNPDIVAQKDGGPAYYTEHGKDGENETCTGYINHRTKGLLKKTIWVQEWVVSSNPNWQTRKHHMAEIRALKQAARMVIHGIPPDPDERHLAEMLNVTATAETVAPTEAGADPATTTKTRRTNVQRSKTGAAAVAEITTATEGPGKTGHQGTTVPGELVEEKTKEPVKTTAPAETTKPATPAPSVAVELTALTPNQVVEVVVMVEDYKCVILNLPDKPPSIIARVKGAFTGEVYHLNGADRVEGSENLRAKPVWQLKAPILLKLEGRAGKTGKVTPIVLEAALHSGPQEQASAEFPA